MTLTSTGFSLNTTNSNQSSYPARGQKKTPTEQLEVTITTIDFTLHRHFRLRLQVHPTGQPLFSKFITLMRFHEHFASAIAVIQDCHDFPELGLPESDLIVIHSLLTDPVVTQYT